MVTPFFAASLWIRGIFLHKAMNPAENFARAIGVFDDAVPVAN
jgi:hypothetical protein